jgi:hypothetical protein
VEPNDKPDIGNSHGRQPNQVPQKISQSQICGLIEWSSDERGLDKEEESGKAQTNEANTSNHTLTIAIEPDSKGQPEERYQVENGKSKRSSL